MNRRILKKFLIIMGLILLGLNFIISLIECEDIFEALFTISFEAVADLGYR